jgi:putative ABC transport system permease protein
LLLGLAGTAAGVFVALAGIRFLVHSPVPIPRLQNAGLNLTVLAFTLVLAVGCAVAFGLVPALRAAGWDLQQTLRDGGRESRGAARERVRAALIVGELCLAQVLLIGAGLLIRSAQLVNAVPPGFDTHNLLAFGVSLWSSRDASPAQMEAGFIEIENAIEAIPGISSVGERRLRRFTAVDGTGRAFARAAMGTTTAPSSRTCAARPRSTSRRCAFHCCAAATSPPVTDPMRRGW